MLAVFYGGYKMVVVVVVNRVVVIHCSSQSLLEI